MNWKYFKPKFEYEEEFNDFAWPWAGHKFFAYDLVSNLKPKKIVELGTHYGTSFWSFSQAVKDQNIETELNAVDSWEGEKHAGFYGEEVFETVNKIKGRFYSDLKINLIRKNFNEALSEFENESIDVLHIDGLHTYEAVKNDFESWFPKVKKGGIILFHDIVVTRDDFGVYKFWNELKSGHETMEFHHSYGLGVLFKGDKNPIFDLRDELMFHYSFSIEDFENGKIDSLFHKIDSKILEIQQKNMEVQRGDIVIEEKNQEIQQKDQEIQRKDQEVQQLNQMIFIMESSKFWKLRRWYLRLRFAIFSPVKFAKKYLKK
ncbi:MAG: hypothetical protein ACD_9C00076G0004 [uncultured bacterium]|nr:MAG: hypothetical protein ACD_9C00076G0004 [uncultured bacterium]